MSQRITGLELAEAAIITTAPAQTRVDRNFGLPTGLYAVTVGAYLAFVGVMASAFMTGQLAVPLAIIAFSIIFGFGVTRSWATMKPGHPEKPLSWGQFGNRGIMTLTGHLTAKEASVQVLILPVLILVWGVTVAIIAALV